MDAEKSIKNEEIDHLIIYGTIPFFGNFLIIFQHYYYAKCTLFYL